MDFDKPLVVDPVPLLHHVLEEGLDTVVGVARQVEHLDAALAVHGDVGAGGERGAAFPDETFGGNRYDRALLHNSFIFQLSNEIGRYAAMARRSGRQWFIGCFNGGKPRTLDLSLSFLEKGKKYEMRRYFDDPGSGTRTRVGIESGVVDRDTVRKASRGERGGGAFRIFPAGPGN